LVLVATPCGIKQSVKQIFNIENLTSHSIKSGSYCQYVSLTTAQKSQSIVVKKKDFKDSISRFSKEISGVKSISTSFPTARSVPLYILYQQLRYSLI